MKVLERLWRGKYAVYHRVPVKNRRDAPIPCSGVAFRRRKAGPVPVNEIPERCDTCGQRIETRYLDFHEVVSVAPPKQASRAPRHYGQIVTETRWAAPQDDPENPLIPKTPYPVQ